MAGLPSPEAIKKLEEQTRQRLMTGLPSPEALAAQQRSMADLYGLEALKKFEERQRKLF